MKKLFVKAVIALLVLIPAASVNAQTQSYLDETEYEFLLGVTVTITKYTGSNTVLVIPAQIQDKNVTTIGTGAFKGANLTGVTIPGSVTLIGEDAFANNQLTGVNIPPSVTAIGNRAFFNNKLTRIDIPGTVITIGNRAFDQNNLTTVSIGYGITTIWDNAFTNNQLASVSIGADVECRNSFPSDFYEYYYKYGRKAGVYTLNAKTGKWAFKAQKNRQN